MPQVVPVDEFIGEEWYPGYRPAYAQAAWVAEPLQNFRKEDESRFWFLDFHVPRGCSPLGLVVMEDAALWGTQWAARHLPLPPGQGLSARLAGTHAYFGDLVVTSPWQVGARVERISRNLPAFLGRFAEIWADRQAELEAGCSHFESLDLGAASLPELAQHLSDARAFHRRSWEIHFEVMYPLVANYMGFAGLCTELGIEREQVPQFLQGYDTKISQCDRELWGLADEARRRGLADLFVSAEPEDLPARLVAAGEAAAPWRSAFEGFLSRFGWRTDGIADVTLDPWIEDPTSPLGTIKTFLMLDATRDVEGDRTAAAQVREEAVDRARSALTVEEQAAFDQGLAGCRVANFAWWNEEHNHYIDMRTTIPLRRIALAIGRELGADRPDDAVFLFFPELVALSRGETSWPSVHNVAGERRDYYQRWLDRRPSMPKVLGTIPDEVLDPVLIEIMGMHHHFLDAIRQASGEDPDVERRTLVGMGAAPGVARGRARVLHSASELHRIEPGEVLVCEATSPNWTPAFGKIAACVCDAGGTLTHASIVSREYRIPCVVGVGLATTSIRDGDEVEVDGSRGVVTVTRA